MVPEKTTLLAVTGLSPQVVTETLYAIHAEGLEWPTDIQLLTTRKGYEQARLGLLVDGHLAQLCRDYQRPVPTFSKNHIHIVPDANNKPVDDARTLADQEALADFITARVAELTENEQQRLHVSLAGGRKTMTFFLGYAMTIFGRRYDRLSHVLVSEPYESVRDFYYPTPYTKRVTARDGKQLLDARLAEVTLAEIPFISQRAILNDALVDEFSRLPYRELIRQLQLAQNPESVALRFQFDPVAPSLWVNDLQVDFSNRKPEFAFFTMAIRPRPDDEEVIERPHDELTRALMTKYFYQELALLAGIPYQASAEQAFLDQLEDMATLNGRTADVLRQSGMTARFFDARKNALQKHLQQHCPEAVVDLIMPAIVRTATGEPVQRKARSPQGGQYGSWLQAKQLSFSHQPE